MRTCWLSSIALLCLTPVVWGTPGTIRVEDRPRDLVFERDAEVTGRVEARTIRVAAGTTLTVRGNGQLVAEGLIVIDGTVVGARGRADGDRRGQDVSIISAQRIDLRGSVRAGDGATTSALHAAGGDAGHLLLQAPVIVLREGIREVVGAHGGHGGAASNGGRGGDVIVHGVMLSADGRTPRVVGGAGGEGGHGAVSPDPSVVHGSRGGNGGDALVLTSPADWRAAALALSGDGNGRPRSDPPSPNGQPGGNGAEITGANGAIGADGPACTNGQDGGAGVNAVGGPGGNGGTGASSVLTNASQNPTTGAWTFTVTPVGAGGTGGNGGVGRGGNGGGGGKVAIAAIQPANPVLEAAVEQAARAEADLVGPAAKAETVPPGKGTSSALVGTAAQVARAAPATGAAAGPEVPMARVALESRRGPRAGTSHWAARVRAATAGAAVKARRTELWDRTASRAERPTA